MRATKARIDRVTRDWSRAKTLQDIRNSFDDFFFAESPATFEPFQIGAIPAAFISGRQPTHRTILFCHGGGYQVGSLKSHSGLMRRLAEAASARVLGFDYRLAPEHRCPAAADDAFAVYRWLLDQVGDGASIAIAGDSAGAALAVQTALRAREAGIGMPGCLALISPWLDLALRGDSYSSQTAADVFSTPDRLALMARAYLGRHREALDPLASPIEADLTGLPPMLIHAGSDDITIDDTELFVRRAEKAGTKVEVRVWPGLFHHFQLFETLPESAESIDELGRFICALT